MKPPRTPDWVVQRQAVHARKARPGQCRCGAPILTGPDEDVAALPAAVDLEPVTPAGELRALDAGLTTHDLIAGELHRRDAWRHRAQHRYPVHVEHVCPEETPMTTPDGGLAVAVALYPESEESA